MYKLDAVDAKEQKLVKQIEGTSPSELIIKHIKLIDVKLKGSPVAKIEIDVFDKGMIKRKQVTVKQNDDLEQLTDRTEYEGYIIKDIYGGEGNEYIDFTSKDDFIRLGESIGSIDDVKSKR